MNDDGKTVAAADLLVPGIGELCGAVSARARGCAAPRAFPNGMNPEDYCGTWSCASTARCPTRLRHGFERHHVPDGVGNIRMCALPAHHQNAEF
jgi:asparaginyl-tRNA synthetase